MLKIALRRLDGLERSIDENIVEEPEVESIHRETCKPVVIQMGGKRKEGDDQKKKS